MPDDDDVDHLEGFSSSPNPFTEEAHNMTEQLTLYLAGPMRGIAEFNFPAFLSAAEHLRAEGHTILSPAEKDIEHHGDYWHGLSGDPAELPPMTFDLEELMREDLLWILGADGIVLLPGWHNSTGARIEALVAKTVGKRIFAYVGDYGFPGEVLVEVLVDVTVVATDSMMAVNRD